MSFFVGDAAGRSRKGTHKTDFSDSDLKFALNIGISFKTETEFFLATNNTSV
jgi:bifunctional polynucleotide phosphatase/kinase